MKSCRLSLGVIAAWRVFHLSGQEEVRAGLEVEIRVLREQSFKADFSTVVVFLDDPLEINHSRTDHVFQIGSHLVLGLRILNQRGRWFQIDRPRVPKVSP